jgi:hypothetical protein
MTVLWYVHHHGAGHRQRLEAVLPHLAANVIAVSSLPAPAGIGCRWERLAADEDPAPADPTARGTLHWAPLAHAGHRGRLARIAALVDAVAATAAVVDVSVEAALFLRLLGVPTVVVAQRGTRTDPAHRLAYGQAAAIAAPWARATHVAGSLPEEDRIEFCGALSRFDGRGFHPPAPGGDVLLVLGAGGHAVDPAAVGAAAAATPGRRWLVAGPVEAPAPVVALGPVADVGALLDRCSVAVGTAGANVVAEVAAARRPFVCLPQPRPFDEQAHHGAALERAGAATVCARWPEPGEWPGVLARAERAGTAGWDAVHDGQGAARLAAVVDRVAAGA